jgi:hypothetical protein
MKYYHLKDALKDLKRIGGILWYDATEKAYYIFPSCIGD